jgi:hypothetical protein
LNCVSGGNFAFALSQNESPSRNAPNYPCEFERIYLAGADAITNHLANAFGWHWSQRSLMPAVATLICGVTRGIKQTEYGTHVYDVLFERI